MLLIRLFLIVDCNLFFNFITCFEENIQLDLGIEFTTIYDVMKYLLIASLAIMILDLQGQSLNQTAFCRFVVSYNQERFDDIYSTFNENFKLQVDQAVVVGGLKHVFETNGSIRSAVIEQQTAEEGVYVAIGDKGVFRILLSVDEEGRIDGVRIKPMDSAPLKAPSLLFRVGQDKGQ
jgi:hypothetical protein